MKMRFLVFILQLGIGLSLGTPSFAYKSSIIHQILYMHNSYLNQGFTSAPNVELASHDIRYAIFAAMDLSHFHAYGVPYQKQITIYSKENYELALNPTAVEEIFRKYLSKTNSINKYVALHSLSIYFAELAGLSTADHQAEAQAMLYYAYLFNAFADHFLQDNFSAGHLVVNRSIFGSIINNQSLHDFYNQQGLQVMNLDG